MTDKTQGYILQYGDKNAVLQDDYGNVILFRSKAEALGYAENLWNYNMTYWAHPVVKGDRSTHLKK